MENYLEIERNKILILTNMDKSPQKMSSQSYQVQYIGYMIYFDSIKEAKFVYSKWSVKWICYLLKWERMYEELDLGKIQEKKIDKIVTIWVGKYLLSKKAVENDW